MKIRNTLAWLLASTYFSAVTGNSDNSVTITVGTNSGQLYVAWAGKFSALPGGQSVTGYSETLLRFDARFPTSHMYIFGQTAGGYFDGTVGQDSWTTDPPTIPNIGQINPISVQQAGFAGFATGVNRIYVPTGYTAGDTTSGCIVVTGQTIDAWTEMTNHAVYSWQPSGFETQELLLTVDKTDRPLCTGSTYPAPPPPSAGGDPHFRTWAGKKYDFHGHCDLVLLDNIKFANGMGLSIHIRSDPFKKIFSYIPRVAIRIGQDVLEIGPRGEHFLNGRAGDQNNLIVESIAGFPLHYSPPPKRGLSRTYTILLGKYTRLIIREKQGWQRIAITGATSAEFASSTGLMGSYGTGEWYGRDGEIIFDSINDYGMEWKVTEKDGFLFQTPSPYPDKCEILTEDDGVMEQRGRRLSESSITREQAMEACFKWVSEEDLDECIFDVMVAEDLGIAELGSYDG